MNQKLFKWFIIFLILKFNFSVINCINRGLVNQGNSCYMNAGIQCLTHVFPLVNYVKLNEAEFNTNPAVKEFVELVKGIRDPINCLDLGKISPYNPKAFYNQNFVKEKFSQQDSSEFIVPFLDKINTISDIVKTVFGFTEISRLTCPICGKISDSKEEILDPVTYEVKSLKNAITLPLIVNPAVQIEYLTINQLLSNYFREEVLDDDNKWICSGCFKYVNAKKRLLLENAPNFLIFIIKRFSSDNQKNKSPVSFPIKDLNIKEFLASQVDTFYNLRGIVVHIGSVSGGHYYAYCKDFQNEQWYKFNDDKISFTGNIINNIANQTEETGNPYILFYERAVHLGSINVNANGPGLISMVCPISVEQSAIIDDELVQKLVTLQITTNEKKNILENLALKSGSKKTKLQGLPIKLIGLKVHLGRLKKKLGALKTQLNILKKRLEP